LSEIEPGRKTGEVITGTIKTARNPPQARAVHNDQLAKSAGFKGGLIMNEYHFTQISEMLMKYFGLRWLTHGEIEIRYIAPLFDRNTFVPKMKVFGEDPPGSGRLSLEIWCENQDGEKLAFGTASCLLDSEERPHE
jgi:hypothetical protein